jgi:hypothetical protein
MSVSETILKKELGRGTETPDPTWLENQPADLGGLLVWTDSGSSCSQSYRT